MKNQKQPTVSVIIPFFNREDFLREAIESVIAQTEKDWELLLIDDGSTDGGVKIAREYQEKYPDKILFLSHPENQNMGASA